MRTRAAQPHLRLQASFFACSSFNPLFLFCVLTMRSCHLKAAPVLRTAAGLPCAHPVTWGTLLDLRAKFFYSWPGPPLARLRPALFHPFSIHYRSFQKGPSWVLVKTETCRGAGRRRVDKWLYTARFYACSSHSTCGIHAKQTKLIKVVSRSSAHLLIFSLFPG